MQEKVYWAWLSQIKGMTMQKEKCLQKKYGNPEAIWKETKVENLMQCVHKSIAEQLVLPQYKQKAAVMVQQMEEKNIYLVPYTHTDYPPLLRYIHHAPVALYIKGNKQLCQTKCMAIVGSRKASDYGKYVAKKLSAGLSKENWTIVSGLAKGIDAKAHEGALQVNGNTIAVVAGGVEHIYPKENTLLYQHILEQGGAILSENGMDTSPEKIDFPKRNRLISGISKGLVVVEATLHSGTSTTIDFALEQGKEVFAVPGNITSLQSQGTNALLREGAKPVMQVGDILEEYM